MNDETLHELIDSMPPDRALDHMAVEIKRLFRELRAGTKTSFLVGLMGGVCQGEVSILVHY